MLSGVEVVADGGLLDALSLGGEVGAGVEAGRLGGVPDAGGVGLAAEETLGLATVDAGGGSGVPSAGNIGLAGSHTQIGTRLLAVTRGTDDAIGIGVALSLLSGTVPAVVASVLAGTVHHLTLRARIAGNDGVQVSAGFSA